MKYPTSSYLFLLEQTDVIQTENPNFIPLIRKGKNDKYPKELEAQYNRLISGEIEITLVERHSYLTLKVANDEWLYNNIFY